MFSLRRLIKNYDETGSLNEQISPQGFINEHLFVTKDGGQRAMLAMKKSSRNRSSASPCP